MKRAKQLLRPGAWGPGQRGRVLVEHSDTLMEWALTGALTEAGYDVAHCHGPGEHEECPLVTTGHCALAEGADVILHELQRRGTDVGADVRSALEQHLPGTPVVVGLQPVFNRRRALRTVHNAITNGGAS